MPVPGPPTAGPRDRPVAVVTGASSGIGAALARCAAADGYDVVLAARRPGPLHGLADALGKRHGTTSTVVAADLAAARGVTTLIKAIADRGLAVDVLINSAGFGMLGEFAEMAKRDVDGMIAVNIAAATRLTRELLPGMLERRRGGVLNVASTAAFQPGPLMSVYYASKAYVLSFSEALWEETRGSGVTVTALCPGPTRTEFLARAKMEDTPLFRNGAVRVMEPEPVARQGWEGFRRGQRVVIPGLANRLGATTAALAPRAALLRIVRRLQQV